MGCLSQLSCSVADVFCMKNGLHPSILFIRGWRQEEPSSLCKGRGPKLWGFVDASAMPQAGSGYARGTAGLSFAAFILQSPIQAVGTKGFVPTALSFDVGNQSILLLCGRRAEVVGLCGSFRSASGRRPATQSSADFTRQSSSSLLFGLAAACSNLQQLAAACSSLPHQT